MLPLGVEVSGGGVNDYKKCCLHARYYPTFQDFKKSILHFIETAHLEKKDRLKSLLTFNFQSFKEVKIGIS